MKRFDQIVEAYYSPEVEALKKNAGKSLTVSVITGVSAVILFGMIGALIFISFLFQWNPLRNPLLLVFFLVGIPTLFILIPTTWVFTFRFFWLSRQAKQTVDEAMRKSIQREGNIPPTG